MVTIKTGSRMLGIAESFRKGKSRKSVLAGVVMRKDLVIDGFSFSFPEVGGMDATDRVIELYDKLNRKDINFLCLSGCIISWFNVIDLNKVYEQISIPLICLTYEESEGLEKYFRDYFPSDYQRRLEVYKRNGERMRVKLKTGHSVFIRCLGVSVRDAIRILNSFIMYGRYPEPVRVARILAYTLSRILIFSGVSESDL
ncbi:MAG: DUF99 domain-containing protein [Candidatus Methanomethylicota archaeon]|uniref:UPF0215 protein DRJ31_10560 n=1 Tax=Thermoproteota archaeon TaxID=2056631 RepID=A0A497EJW9_9CREN|nr:MAG: DUF99 domain-containing protein [Candidatus Verstraetearchaeota archaeon]